MSFTFKSLEDNYQLFFEMLPKDWQDLIVPFWEEYKNSSNLYVIFEGETLLGGGIVFSVCPPDLRFYEKEAQQWFDNGYQYLGFIWIAEEKRNHNLGSFWLEELKRKHPLQKYWLLIEEERLHHFYQKNSFILNTSIQNDDHVEWLYSFEPIST